MLGNGVTGVVINPHLWPEATKTCFYLSVVETTIDLVVLKISILRSYKIEVEMGLR